MPAQPHATASPSIFGTLVVFAVAYTFALVLLLVVASFVGLAGSSAASVGALLAAGAQSGFGYARKAGAPASGGRLWALITGSFLIAVLVSIVLFFGMPLISGGTALETRGILRDTLQWLGSLEPGALASLLAIFIVPNVFMLWLAYGPLTRLIWRRQPQG